MLAEDQCVDASGGDVQRGGEGLAQAAGVEQGAGADHALRGEARDGMGAVGHQVDRVGGDQQDAVEAGRHQLGCAGLDDGRAARGDGEPTLVAMRGGAGGDDGDGGGGGAGLGARGC